VGIVDDEGTSRRIVPDVTVIRKASDTTTAAATVTLSERRATISASVEVTIASEPLRHQVVEIRGALRPLGAHPCTALTAALVDDRLVTGRVLRRFASRHDVL
jgi:hypothetical protein